MVEQQQVITIKLMCERIGRKRTTLWSWVQTGKFPQPLKINSKTLGWTEKQYSQWLASLTMEAK